MTVLLDTHMLLWAAGFPDRLPRGARDLIEDDGTELLYSAASIWEVAIKSGLGRGDFRCRSAYPASRPAHVRLQAS